ncbi:MAG TPA: phosphatase PAP2 family protein, partial [Armatimonadota bacterium]|nr:phosphatase PAP2 family protein [Armatimonadota bacterium]
SFLLATLLWFASEDKAWALVGFVLAALVAQSRVEGRIHSVREVVYGAVAGVSLAAAIYAIGAGVRAAL